MYTIENVKFVITKGHIWFCTIFISLMASMLNAFVVKWNFLPETTASDVFSYWNLLQLWLLEGFALSFHSLPT